MIQNFFIFKNKLTNSYNFNNVDVTSIWEFNNTYIL